MASATVKSVRVGGTYRLAGIPLSVVIDNEGAMAVMSTESSVGLKTLQRDGRKLMNDQPLKLAGGPN